MRYGPLLLIVAWLLWMPLILGGILIAANVGVKTVSAQFEVPLLSQIVSWYYFDYVLLGDVIIAAVLGLGLAFWSATIKMEGAKAVSEDNSTEQEDNTPSVVKDTKVKLDAKNTDKATGMEITTPTDLSNVRVEVTAANVKEATGLRVTAINTEFAARSKVIVCPCGEMIRSFTTHGYKPTVKCPKCGKEYTD